MFKQERSNRHLFSRHDNRHAHSDMGDLETYFGMVSHLSYLLPRLTSKVKCHVFLCSFCFHFKSSLRKELTFCNATTGVQAK